MRLFRDPHAQGDHFEVLWPIKSLNGNWDLLTSNNRDLYPYRRTLTFYTPSEIYIPSQRILPDSKALKEQLEQAYSKLHALEPQH